jgi:transcriptional regulator with XRE-family HTH domain
MECCGVNGAELAALSGVSAATISRYLNGLRQPTVDNIIRLADALDVSTDYLLCLHNVPDDKMLVSTYSVATADDKKVIWALLERYGGNNETTYRK